MEFDYEKMTKSEIVATVSILADFTRLESDTKAIEKEFLKARNEAEYERLAKLHDKMQAAVDKAADRTFAFQLTPDLYITTPLAVLERSFDLFTKPERDEFRKPHKLHADEFNPIAFGDEPEERPDHLPMLIEIRKLMDSGMNLAERRDRIDALVQSSPEQAREIFGEDGFEPGIRPAEFIESEEMRGRGIPRASALHKLGYTTVESLAELDPQTLRKVKGFGPKTIIELEKIKEKVRKGKM